MVDQNTQDSARARSRQLKDLISTLIGQGFDVGSADDSLTGEPNDQAYLLRFLNAHRDNVDKAAKHFAEVYQWRKSQRLEETYLNVDCSTFTRAQNLYGLWNGRRDRNGNPLCIYEINKLDLADVNDYQIEVKRYKENHAFHRHTETPPNTILVSNLLEYLMRFIFPVCTAISKRSHPEKPITRSINIIDVSDVSLHKWWTLKNHIGEASRQNTKYFPDMLDKTFVVGAPAFFPIIFGAVQTWFAPAMIDKITILKKAEVTQKLLVDISPEDLPTKYGGQLEWKYGDPPSLDQTLQDVLETDGNSGWVEGPCLFKNGKSVPVGTVNGVRR